MEIENTCSQEDTIKKIKKTSHNWKGLGEYSANTVYTCMLMEKWDLLKLFQELERKGKKENDGGVNLSMI
jgi:hypothetical protein